MLSLYKLEIFNTVAKEGSFSKAADRLLLTQPAVSQHMRDLEISLQAPLFIRGSRGVKLTQAGETLLDYTRSILRLVSEAEEAIIRSDTPEIKQIAIGATPGAGSNLLPSLIQDFQRRYPGIRISLTTGTTTVIATEILTASLEIGFIEGELSVEPPLIALPLREIDLFVLVGPDHPWNNRDSIPAAALNGQPFITRPAGSKTRAWIDQMFLKYDLTPDIIAEFDRPEAIMSAVAAGMGITIQPDWGITNGPGGKLKALSIQGVQMQRTLRLLWSEDRPLKPTVKSFLSHLSVQFPKLSQIIPAEGDEFINAHHKPV